MKIQTYKDMTITFLSSTVNPNRILRAALDITMKKDLNFSDIISEKTCQFLIKAEHMSVFEHCSMTILVKGISRSLLAQLTRQRTFSFTSGSQHYQDYREHPCVVGEELAESCLPLHASIRAYSNLVDGGMKPEEARQVLPNAAAVNLMITMDACNMIKFFRARRCERNVEEMITFADKLHTLAVDWWPEVFRKVGAPCYMDGKCNQGHMMCEDSRAGLGLSQEHEEICPLCARVHEEGESCV